MLATGDAPGHGARHGLASGTLGDASGLAEKRVRSTPRRSTQVPTHLELSRSIRAPTMVESPVDLAAVQPAQKRGRRDNAPATTTAKRGLARHAQRGDGVWSGCRGRHRSSLTRRPPPTRALMRQRECRDGCARPARTTRSRPESRSARRHYGPTRRSANRLASSRCCS